MEGLIHRASIYRRVTVGAQDVWEETPFITDYKLRVDTISPQAVLREVYASCSHSAVGEANVDIAQGMRMEITSTGWCAGMEFAINGVAPKDAGSPSLHHLEIMLTESKL